MTGRFLALMIIAVLSTIFFRPILYFVRRVKARRFQAQLMLLSAGRLDSKAYSKLRETFDKINSNLNLLENIHQTDLKNVPWIIKGTVRDIQQLADDLLVWRMQFSSILHKLDSEIDDSGAKYFKIVPESQLWERRTKAYAYRL
jgi:type II secretory pathway pseudopilin PulG